MLIGKFTEVKSVIQKGIRNTKSKLGIQPYYYDPESRTLEKEPTPGFVKANQPQNTPKKGWFSRFVPTASLVVLTSSLLPRPLIEAVKAPFMPLDPINKCPVEIGEVPLKFQKHNLQILRNEFGQMKVKGTLTFTKGNEVLKVALEKPLNGSDSEREVENLENSFTYKKPTSFHYHYPTEEAVDRNLRALQCFHSLNIQESNGLNSRYIKKLQRQTQPPFQKARVREINGLAFPLYPFENKEDISEESNSTYLPLGLSLKQQLKTTVLNNSKLMCAADKPNTGSWSLGSSIQDSELIDFKPSNKQANCNKEATDIQKALVTNFAIKAALSKSSGADFETDERNLDNNQAEYYPRYFSYPIIKLKLPGLTQTQYKLIKQAITKYYVETGSDKSVYELLENLSMPINGKQLTKAELRLYKAVERIIF